MLPDNDYRQLAGRAGEPRPDRPQWKKLFRESLDTLILGSLSTSIGIVVMIVLFSGIAGRPVAGWNVAPIAPTARKYLIPTQDCGIAAVAGECLGVAGILVGWTRRGVISPLSTLGTMISLGHMYLFFVHVAIMELF